LDYSITLKNEIGRAKWNVWEAGEVHTGFRWEVLRRRGHLENLGIDERILLKRIDLTQDGDCLNAVLNLMVL
jgi:hypothetical protein